MGEYDQGAGILIEEHGTVPLLVPVLHPTEYLTNLSKNIPMRELEPIL